MASSSTKNRSFIHRPLYLIVGLLVIVGAGYLIARATFLKSKTPAVPRTANSYTKGQPAGSSGSSSSGNQSSSGQSTTSGSQKGGSGGSSAVVITPSGNFVSDHHPNLSGSPAPNTLTSVCNTTPGAACQISFTMDGVTKSLPSQTTDSGGSTYWTNWKLQDVGLTAGTWKVQATASLDGQTQTAYDAMDLVVSQ